MKEELINTQAVLVACERKLAAVEQERDQARQEAAQLRRQVEVLCERHALVADCPDFGPCKHDNNCTTCWADWAAQQAGASEGAADALERMFPALPTHGNGQPLSMSEDQIIAAFEAEAKGGASD